MLLTLPDMLTADELRRIREILRGAAWVDGRETAGFQAAAVKNNQQLAPRGDMARALQGIVLAALSRHPTFFSAVLPKRVLPPMFNRYAGDANTYGDHVDQAIRFVPDSNQRLRTDISCTLFFSAPEEYDGGELVMEDAFGGRRVKLPAGHLVLYPSTTVHRVEPVTRGERLASFFWIESMVRSTEQRRLLYDLDMALMKLRERDPDSDVSVTLSGTYHNLLRLWADT
ncbi:MAG: Fe2+-dependent dioxygenase [Piscinibacter sp.]|nr:Fe2+-dependent dioxygenase [Piscinibacter sp.]